MLGFDLGWVPSLPNSVANEINGSPYLEAGADGVLDLVFDLLEDENAGGVLGPILDLLNLDLGTVLGDLTDLIDEIRDPITSQIPDLIHARVTPTIGIGLGAFAAAMAYQQVIDDLANQPGGTAYNGVDPILGSLTILPLVLINNPGRPDGGAFARFGPLAALFGIDTVNPRTELTGNGGVPLGNTGLHLGGANVLPILIDATYEYQPMSDLASWPNPFTLANNLAAGLLPTYMLRGLSLDGLEDQILDQVGEAVGNVGAGNPLALNIYLTLDSATLPMLEPLYLASDLLNIIGLSPLAQIPMRIANAIAPALGILTDAGYGNVVRNPDGTYTRDFSTAGDEVPFLSFPDLNPGQVLTDTITALFGGIQKELGPNPTPGTPNALKTLLDALLGGGLGGLLGGTSTSTGTGTGTGTPATNPLGGLSALLNNVLGGLLGGGLLGGLNPLAATQGLAPSSASSVPTANARLMTLASEDSTVEKGETTPTATESETVKDEVKTPAEDTSEPKGAEADPTEAATETPAAQESPAPEEPTALEETKPEETKAPEETAPAA